MAPSKIPSTLLVVLLVVGGLAAPSARAAPGDSDPEKSFFRAYYLEHAETRPQEALVLYLEYLRASPEGTYARPAARFAHRILRRGGSPRMLEEFMRSYAGLLPQDGSVPTAPPAEVMGPGALGPSAPSRGPDAQLLARLETLASEGRVAPEVKWAERLLQAAEGMWRKGDFMNTVRQVTRAYRILAISRVAQMIQRKVAETDALKKNLRVKEGFGGGADTLDLKQRIEENEKAIRDARTDDGVYEQIARLYPGAFEKIGEYGFLGLTLGIKDPNDPLFLGWPKAARAWLRAQSLRRTASEDAVRDALELGQRIQDLQDRIQEMRLDEARALARQLWTVLSSG